MCMCACEYVCECVRVFVCEYVCAIIAYAEHVLSAHVRVCYLQCGASRRGAEYLLWACCSTACEDAWSFHRRKGMEWV